MLRHAPTSAMTTFSAAKVRSIAWTSSASATFAGGQ
jgi:hypothetical protein